MARRTWSACFACVNLKLDQEVPLSRKQNDRGRPQGPSEEDFTTSSFEDHLCVGRVQRGGMCVSMYLMKDRDGQTSEI